VRLLPLLGAPGALALALGVAGTAVGGVGIVSEATPTRVRARARVAALSASLATHPEPRAPLRYRAVGCVAHGGAVAHFNGPSRREVALTFDDGPSPLTLRFVRMLRAEGVKATFFMLGKQLSSGYRGVLAEELRDGDALGDHSWSHPNLVFSGEARSQLAGTKGAIASLSGYTPCVFRPPYGAFDGSVLHTASSLGLATVIWNVDPRDWALPGVGSIEATVLAQVKPGSIVLSHDGGGPRAQTLAAYPHIIAALRRRGYRFATVPELLGYPTVYRPCRSDCGEAAIQGRPPRGSIIQAASSRAVGAWRPLAPASILSR